MFDTLRAARGRVGGACALLMVVAISALAGDGLDLSWSTVDGGGTRSTGGGFTLEGTIGQPDAAVLTGGTYRLNGGFWQGGAMVVAVDDPDPNATPLTFHVHPNTPNPFNPATTVRFDLPRIEDTTVAIYDARGVRVRLLLQERLESGAHTVAWDGRDDRGSLLAAGIYFMRIQAGTDRHVQKMVLLK